MGAGQMNNTIKAAEAIRSAFDPKTLSKAATIALGSVPASTNGFVKAQQLLGKRCSTNYCIDE